MNRARNWFRHRTWVTGAIDFGGELVEAFSRHRVGVVQQAICNCRPGAPETANMFGRSADRLLTSAVYPKEILC